MSNNITIYTKKGCIFCYKTKQLLEHVQLPYNEKCLDPTKHDYESKKNKLFNLYNHNSFPIIIINDKLLGGYSDLINYYNTSTLQKFYKSIGFNIY